MSAEIVDFVKHGGSFLEASLAFTIRHRSRLRELWTLNEERPTGHLIAGVPSYHTANPSGRRAAARIHGDDPRT